MKTKKLSYRHRILAALTYRELHFLLEYNCLGEYLDNCCNEKDYEFLESFEKRDILYENSVFITSAFTWSTTPQGYDYWWRRANWFVKQFLN